MHISDSRIERALRSPGDFDELFDRADHANLADRLEEALHGGALELKELARHLGVLAATRATALHKANNGKGLESDLSSDLAYQAGVLGFAQLMAAQAATKRAPDRVQDVARSIPLAPYVAELQCGERTNSRLAELTGETEETVSRKLKKLRRHGITAFRRDGRLTTNYLTPLGRALAGLTGNSTVEDDHGKSQIVESKLLKQVLVRELEARVQPDPHLRDLAILGADSEAYEPRRAHGR